MLHKILKPLSSLRITVTLIFLSIVLIYAGTNAQVGKGIWEVQKTFFHSFFFKLEIQDLIPRFANKARSNFGWLPFPGGYILGSLLLLNVLSAHITKFKITLQSFALTIIELAPCVALFWFWYYNDGTKANLAFAGGLALIALLLATLFLIYHKRAGVILIHLGLILLLVGEGVASGMQKESQMTIDEGSYARYSQDTRYGEIAIVEVGAGDADDKHTVIGHQALKNGAQFRGAPLPFDIKVDEFFPNASFVNIAKLPGKPAILDSKGNSFTIEAKSSSGTESAVDSPGAFVTISRNGNKIATHLLHVFLTDPEIVDVDGKKYQLSLRFTRLYKPYTIQLKDFRHDLYEGTNTPRNFSSDVVLIDPTHNERREVHIAMNSPMRYQGETFFQASFKPGNLTTILQVVSNPGAMLPYVAVIISGLGLIVHFLTALIIFLTRAPLGKEKLATIYGVTFVAKALGVIAYIVLGTTGVVVVGLLIGMFVVGLIVYNTTGNRDVVVDPARPTVGQIRKQQEVKQRRELAPDSDGFFSSAVLMPLAVLLLCGIYVLSHAVPSRATETFDISTFGKLPISFDGRVQPMDSMARNALKVMRSRESAVLVKGTGKDEESTRIPGITWLLDTMTQKTGFEQYKSFRIDHEDVKTLMGIEAREKFFSFSDIRPGLDKLKAQAMSVDSIPKKERSLYQHAISDLNGKMILYGRIMSAGGLLLTPPISGNDGWKTLDEADRKLPDHPTIKTLVPALIAYQKQDAGTFNKLINNYNGEIEKQLPRIATKASFEKWFNRFDAFWTSFWFYVLIFILSAFSWLGWRKPLVRSAFWVMLFALVIHTFGLVARIYISGRPPVTNLASSAIFIGWGAAVFAILLEMIYKNSLGCALGAVVAAPTLLIADRLALSGDTLGVLQAVLDTNIWLATHVVIITLGYAATYLAGVFGIAYLVMRAACALFTLDFPQDSRKALTRMTYGVTCFALVCSFVGTILGGIWADQSWGRFWGWDPKENGAILIVLGNALLLHSRWGGIARERGIAVLAIFGMIITTWSWFGTNMLGEGLHAYGFMESATFWFPLAEFCFMGLMALALIPFEDTIDPTDKSVRGFDPTIK